MILETNMHSVKNRAFTLLQNGQADAAVDLLTDACRRQPDEVDGWFLLADVHGRLGQYTQTLDCCRKILALNPSHVGALIFEGMAMMALGRYENAADSLRRALERKPNDPLIISKLGHCMLLAGECRQAEELFRRTLALDPKNAAAHLFLAKTLAESGRYPEAHSHFARAIECDRGYYDAYRDFGAFLTGYGDLQRGETMLREALYIQPDSINVQRQLVINLGMQGRFEDAIVLCDKLLRTEPANIDVMTDKIEILERKGDIANASRLIGQVIGEHFHTAKSVSLFTELCGKERPDEAIQLCQKVLAQPRIDTISRQRLHYALGKLLDQLGNYDQAFDHYKRANDLSPDHFDPAKLPNKTTRLMVACSRDSLAGLARSSSSLKTVFIVGMPRSGTTLLEQILASHPRIHGAGELPYISEMSRRLRSLLGTAGDYPECLAAMDHGLLDNLAREYADRSGWSMESAECLVDKMPQNYLHLGLIQMLFPNARILHCVRHPLDVCLSIYFQSFHGDHSYATRLKNIAAYYREYWRLMRHWKTVLEIPILDVVYENLVVEPEAISRSAVEFCGMPWDARCLRFHEAGNVAITASYSQVRKPIYRSALARWKNYEKHLEPLRSELQDVLTEFEKAYPAVP